MEHPPRFDKPAVDPTSLKPALAKLVNATLGKLWLNSKLKDKIIIGQHSIESSGTGDAHNVNPVTGNYDGVHLYGVTGCKDYTNSLKSILMMSLSRNESGTAPVVPTKNRFSVFNTNLGN